VAGGDGRMGLPCVPAMATVPLTSGAGETIQAEALHALLLAHIEHLGVDEELARSLRSELTHKLDGVAGSSLFNLYQFAIGGSVQVALHNLAGLLCTIEATTASTVRDLKVALEKQKGIPMHEQVLLRRGKQMQDSEVLAAYQISPLDPSVTVVRVRIPRIYVLGGCDMDGEVLATMEAFDSTLGTWQAVAPMHTPRHNFTSAVIDGKLYVVGGQSSEEIITSAEVFDPETGAWDILPPMGLPRMNCSSAVIDGKLYLVGGDDGNQALASIEAFDTRSRKWEMLPPMARPRWYTASVNVGGKLYVIGGDDGNEAFDCVEVLDPDSRSWESLWPMQARRFGLRAANLGGKLYVMGGYDGENVLSSAEAFDPALRAWESLPPMWTPRMRSASAVLGDRLYAIGGSDDGALAKCDVYDPCLGAWLPIATMGTPRVDASAVAADGRLYVLGGHDGEDTLGSAEVYDARSGAWAAFPSVCGCGD